MLTRPASTRRTPAALSAVETESPPAAVTGHGVRRAVRLYGALPHPGWRKQRRGQRSSPVVRSTVSTRLWRSRPDVASRAQPGCPCRLRGALTAEDWAAEGEQCAPAARGGSARTPGRYRAPRCPEPRGPPASTTGGRGWTTPLNTMPHRLFPGFRFTPARGTPSGRAGMASRRWRTGLAAWRLSFVYCWRCFAAYARQLISWRHLLAGETVARWRPGVRCGYLVARVAGRHRGSPG